MIGGGYHADIDNWPHNVQGMNQNPLCAGPLNVLKWSRDHWDLFALNRPLGPLGSLRLIRRALFVCLDGMQLAGPRGASELRVW